MSFFCGESFRYSQTITKALNERRFAQIAHTGPGTWIGAAQVNSHEVPFRLEIAGSGDQVQAALVNGKEKSAASSGSYADRHLVLHFDYYANTLDAMLEDGTLTGTFSGRGHSVPVTAKLNGKLPVADANGPHIGGLWEVAVDNGAKGEHSWKLRVRQTGPHVNAVIERIDGDTGNLYGIWSGGAYTVSHFTAAGPNFAVLLRSRMGPFTWKRLRTAGRCRPFRPIVRLQCKPLLWKAPMTLCTTHS